MNRRRSVFGLVRVLFWFRLYCRVGFLGSGTPMRALPKRQPFKLRFPKRWGHPDIQTNLDMWGLAPETRWRTGIEVGHSLLEPSGRDSFPPSPPTNPDQLLLPSTAPVFDSTGRCTADQHHRHRIPIYVCR